MNITLLAATVTRVNPRRGPKEGGVILQNNSGVDIYLGGSEAVTADDGPTGGYILADGKELALSDGGGVDLTSRFLYAVHNDAGDVKLTLLVL